MSKNNFLANFKLEKQDYIEDKSIVTPIVKKEETSDTLEVETEEEEDEVEIEGNPLITTEKTETEEEDEEVKVPEVKTEVTKEESSQDEEISFTPFISHLSEEGILIPTGEKKYDDNLDGFTKIVEDTVEAKFNEKIESLPEDAKKLVKLAKEGVDIKQLLKIENEEVDFTKIDIEDPDNQYNLVLDHLLMTGHTEEEAKELVDGYKDANLLVKQSKVAIKILSEAQNKRKTEFINTQKAEAKAKEDAKIKESTAFKEKVLSTSKIGTVELSKPEAEKLYNYMTRVVKEGKTQYELDGNEENRMMLAYLMMNKFNSDKIEKKVETKKTKEIKKALSRYKDKNAEIQSSIKNPEAEKQSLKLPKLSWL